MHKVLPNPLSFYRGIPEILSKIFAVSLKNIGLYLQWRMPLSILPFMMITPTNPM